MVNIESLSHFFWSSVHLKVSGTLKVYNILSYKQTNNTCKVYMKGIYLSDSSMAFMWQHSLGCNITLMSEENSLIVSNSFKFIFHRNKIKLLGEGEQSAGRCVAMRPMWPWPTF